MIMSAQLIFFIAILRLLSPRRLFKCIVFVLLLPKDVPRVLTVLNTTKAERNTQQNNKDNQGFFAATLSFMLTQSSGNMKIGCRPCRYICQERVV